MTSKPDADARLIGAHDLALAALREVTRASSIGPAAGFLAEGDGSVSLRFENRLAGYPGWYWTVTVARVDDEDPTVLEVELLPGDSALLAPEWVPWVERLAEYRAHQAEAALAVDSEAADGDDDDDDDDDDAVDILHAGDLDGVDIDELDVDVDVDELDESARAESARAESARAESARADSGGADAVEDDADAQDSNAGEGDQKE